MNIPVGIIALFIILFTLPAQNNEHERKKIDFLGLAVLVIVIVPLILAFTWGGNLYEWGSIQIMGMLLFSLIMTVIFALIEKRVVDPIMPLSLFKNSAFNFSAIGMFLVSVVQVGAAIFLPLFIQGVIGTSASKSGAIMTPMIFGLSAGAIISGFIISKTGKYKVQSIIGFAVIGIGTVLVSLLGVNSAISQVLIYMGVLGIGIGIVTPIFNSAAQNASLEKQMGIVTSGVQFFRLMGQTVGSAVLATIMSSSISDGIKSLDVSRFPAEISKQIINPNILTNSGAINELRSNLPARLLTDFDRLMEQLKQILSNSIHDVFAICIIITAFALIAIMFMKEIPIKKAAE